MKAQRSSRKTPDSYEKFFSQTPFFRRSHAIYDVTSGLYDYYDLGTKMMRNIKDLFLQRYVSDLHCIEHEGTILGSEDVFRGSGHLESFHDTEGTCASCHGSFKIEETLKLDSVVCPTCGKRDIRTKTRNLMFHMNDIFMRPETVQSIYSSYDLIRSQRTLPFSIIQFGKGFRNEISPRQELLRLIELNMCEILTFSESKTEDQFVEYAPMFSLNYVLNDEKSGTLDSKTFERSSSIAPRRLLSHLFIANDFLQSLGIPFDSLRFRQHKSTERAHYSSDTWDAEIWFPSREVWIEVAGISDRDKNDFLSIFKFLKRPLDETSMPYVIEQSFGLDRIFLSLLETGFHEDVLDLHPMVAPILLEIGPLVKKDQRLVQKAQEIFKRIRDLLRPFLREIRYQDKGSIGKRYRRADLIGVSQFITIDSQTLEDGTFTVRDRKTKNQTRQSTKDFLFSLTKFLTT